MEPSPTPEESEKELSNEEFIIENDEKSFKMKVSCGNENINFFVESLKEFPIKYYELNTFLSTLQKEDENFFLFNTPKKLIYAIEKCIKLKKFKSSSNDEMFNLSIENHFFENNLATINIPLKEPDLTNHVNSLTNVILNLKEELNKANELIEQLKNERENEKELKKQKKIKLAKESFEGTNILNDEEKVLISEWIDEEKVFKFDLLFNTNKDGASCAAFHNNCDGMSPTVTIVKDINGNKFGGYTVAPWNQPGLGGNYAREQNAFIFNLSKKMKYLQQDKFVKFSIYRNNGYGPTFGAGYCLFLADNCVNNSNSYTNVHSSYKTDNVNLIGNSGNSNFQVSCYEVYHVIRE
jgi:hypothetical protein